MTYLNLELPEGAAGFPAAVFTQDGEFVDVGDREACEQKAIEIGGLYCWIADGKAVVRHDFEPEPEPEQMIDLDVEKLRGEIAPLYEKRETEAEPQPAYVYMTEDGTVTADWTADRSSMLAKVWHNRTLHWSVNPNVKGDVLIDLLEGKALPLLERVYAGHSVDWDGHNHRGTLDEDAEEASEELQELFDIETNNEENQTQVWTASEWLFSTSNWLDDHWTNEDIDVVAESIEADAVRDGIYIEGSIKRALLDAAGQMYDDDKRLTQAQLLALYENDRIDIKPIVSKRDKALTVFINRSQASAQVFYEYDAKALDEVQWRATGYQTADMPMDDEAAVEMVSEWLDAQGG